MKFFNAFGLTICVAVIMCGCTATPDSESSKAQIETNVNSNVKTSPASDPGKAQDLTSEALLLAKPNQFKATEPSMSAAMSESVKSALTMLKQQKLKQASKLISQYTTVDTTHSAIWVLSGDIAAAQKQDTQLVIDAFNQAINVNPHNYLAHNRLAILLTKQGKFDQALNHYQQAIKSWPGFAPAYLNRGILLDMYMGKKQQALESYQTYQGLLTVTQGQGGKKVRGWIVDLSRQLKQQG